MPPRLVWRPGVRRQSPRHPPFQRSHDRVFEEEGIAKGKAAVSYNGKMVDTPVYLNALDILASDKEIKEKEATRK